MHYYLYMLYKYLIPTCIACILLIGVYKFAKKYIVYIPVLVSVYSLYEVYKIIRQYVLFYRFDISLDYTLGKLLVGFFACIPAIIICILYRYLKKKIKRGYEFDRMRIKDL